MAQLTDKVAFVTAAGGAIAGATACRFSMEGAAVYCVDIDNDTVAQTVATITKDGGQAIASHCDVTDQMEVQEALDACVAEFGRLDIVFNAAAAQEPSATVETMSLETWNEVVDVNLLSLIHISEPTRPY